MNGEKEVGVTVMPQVPVQVQGKIQGQGQQLLLGGNVGLVAHEGDADIGGRELPRFVEPAPQVVECLAPGDVEHQQRPGGVAVVGARYAAEGLLARCVPLYVVHCA
jgi:hypothetical protein